MYYIQANDNFAWHAKERAPVKFKYSESNQWWGQFASEWIFLRISNDDSPPIFFFIVVEGCIWSHYILHGHFFPVLKPKFDQTLVWCKFRRRTSQNIVTSNSFFFVIWKLQTLYYVCPFQCLWARRPRDRRWLNASISNEGAALEELKKCLADSFRKWECCTACEQTRAKKGMCIKDLNAKH